MATEYKRVKKKESAGHQVADGKAASVIGTHDYYEARRRERNPEKYKHQIVVYGAEMPKRVKGRTKRGWTTPLK